MYSYCSKKRLYCSKGYSVAGNIRKRLQTTMKCLVVGNVWVAARNMRKRLQRSGEQRVVGHAAKCTSPCQTNKMRPKNIYKFSAFIEQL